MHSSISVTANGNILNDGNFKRLSGGNAARKYRIVSMFVITTAQLHSHFASALEQAPPTGVGGNQRTVTGQGQAHGLGQAVHGIGGKHTRAGAAGRAGTA